MRFQNRVPLGKNHLHLAEFCYSGSNQGAVIAVFLRHFLHHTCENIRPVSAYCQIWLSHEHRTYYCTILTQYSSLNAAKGNESDKYFCSADLFYLGFTHPQHSHESISTEGFFSYINICIQFINHFPFLNRLQLGIRYKQYNSEYFTT